MISTIGAVPAATLMAGTRYLGVSRAQGSTTDPDDLDDKLGRFGDFLDTAHDLVLLGGDGSLPRQIIGAGLSIASDTVGAVSSTRGLIAAVSGFRNVRAEQRLHPQRYLDETAKVQWERDKFVHKAEIADNSYQLIKAAASVTGTLTDLLGTAAEKLIDSPDSLVLAGLAIQSSGAAAGATAVIAAVGPWLAAAAVVMAVSMGVALVARTYFQHQQKKREQQLADATAPPGAASAPGMPPSSGNEPTSPPPESATAPLNPGASAGSPLPSPPSPCSTQSHSSRSSTMINTDPETMRSVSQALATFTEDIQAAKAALQASVNGASDSWQDEVYQHAQDTVADVLARIEPSEECSSLASHIDAKASALEEYNAR